MAKQYDETGEELVQICVLDENGIQQGEKLMLTNAQADELVDGLPEGWITEEA